MAGRLPDTRRIRVVTARRGEDGERQSLETKDGDRESLKTKDGDPESLETKKRIRESGDLPGRARLPCGDNGTPPYFGLFRELWTGRRSATSRRWSSTQTCHKHHGNQRDDRSGQNIGWKRYVKDKWVNQESRTLNPAWRDPAGHAQKGNNSSRRPYIRPQSAGSWISRSRGVKPSRSIRYQSEQLISQIVYKGATASRVVGKAAPWEPTRSKIDTLRRSGLGYQESPN